MQQDAHQGWEMAQEIIFLPDGGPREIKQDGAHNAQDDHQQRAKHSIHERRADPPKDPKVIESASEERRCAHPHRDNRYSSRKLEKTSSELRPARPPTPGPLLNHTAMRECC